MIQAELKKLVHGNNAFAVDLYQQLQKSDGNLFFSPFNISTALAMTYAGARAETESQMARTLHFDETGDGLHAAFADLQAKLIEVESAGVILKTANSLWPLSGYAFLDSYLDLVKKHYGVIVTPLDYKNDPEKGRNVINQWVEDRTEMKIRNLIPRGLLDALTRLVLTNAIYFKGNWADRFDPRLTKRSDFWAPQGKVYASMMSRTHDYNYAETGSLQILELPYAGKTSSMFILLPQERDGLAVLEGQLTLACIEESIEKLRQEQVFVTVPRLKIETAFQLNEALIGLGMPNAFNSNKANFAGMDGNENWLYIGCVLHKAFIEANEEGTEAAAATAVVMRSKGLSKTLEVRADHPFIFLIRENQTGSILFMGRLLKP